MFLIVLINFIKTLDMLLNGTYTKGTLKVPVGNKGGLT